MGNERYRVYVLDDYEGLAATVRAHDELAARADVTILRERLATDEALATTLRGAAALLLVRERTRFGERQLASLSNLKLISQTGRGIAHIDLPAATRLGIAVAVTPGDSGMATVELTFGLILAVARRICEIDRKMRAETWPTSPGRSLEGKTLGVVGLGRLGREVARTAQAFRMRVLATAKTLTDDRAAAVGAVKKSLVELLEESDIVTIHVPLNDETRGLIGEKEIRRMKPGALLVNTSRGPIVSETALIAALESGRLDGAGLDVFDIEPLPMEHPLRRLENVVLSPHRGYGTVEVLRDRYELAMKNILDFFSDKPVTLLNPEAPANRRD
jgi:phosphoglycerate dehydrogenase-like enzyme